MKVGDQELSNVPVEEVARWFSLRDISVIAIGEIDLPDSVPTI